MSVAQLAYAGNPHNSIADRYEFSSLPHENRPDSKEICMCVVMWAWNRENFEACYPDIEYPKKQRNKETKKFQKTWWNDSCDGMRAPLTDCQACKKWREFTQWLQSSDTRLSYVTRQYVSWMTWLTHAKHIEQFIIKQVEVYLFFYIVIITRSDCSFIWISVSSLVYN